jgi:hypothetical protein
MVQRGLVGSVSASCKAGPSLILGSAPQGGFPTELPSNEDMDRGPGEWGQINVLSCMNVTKEMYVCYKI